MIEKLDKVIGNIYEGAITRFDPAIRIKEEEINAPVDVDPGAIIKDLNEIIAKL